MKHIAIRSRSVGNPNLPFTVPGLGDRIHTILTGWAYSQANNIQVTLHLTSDKWDKNKPSSFKEILSLFPSDKVFIQPHPVSMLTEIEWLSYLNTNGIDAELFCYLDHLGWYESKEELDISKYLSTYPKLCAENLELDLSLPEKFITTQWDSVSPIRTLNKLAQKEILEKYSEQGFEILTIGGLAENPKLMKSLKHIAYALSKASLHVGVDSGFMHMAQLYLENEKIHLYKEPAAIWSHHMLRAIDNGSPINLYYKRITFLHKIVRLLVYDNRMFTRLIKNNKITKKFLYENAILRKLISGERKLF